MASYNSAIIIFGHPAEIYAYGAQYMVNSLGLIGVAAASFIYVPVMYPLNLSSSFEYFEVRYDGKLVRLLAACMYLLYMSLYMGTALYAPVMALSSMTNFPKWAAILLAGGICSVYSSLGGLRGVVWTDVFQIIVMFGSMLTTFVYGIVQAGGVKKVYDVSKRFGRLDFFNFNPDPFQRHSFWLLVSNTAFQWIFVYGAAQGSFQRYVSMPTFRKAQLALGLNVPILLLMALISNLTGLILFANYATCDPILTGDIEKIDEILPFFLDDKMGHINGIAGLFFASLFAGGLSSVSSGLNSLASVAWEDGLKISGWPDSLSEQKQVLVVRILGFGFGVLGVGLAFMSSTLGSINQVNLTLTTTFASPIMAMFLASIFLPFVNKPGILAGALLSFVMASWAGFGKLSRKMPPPTRLPSSIENCANETESMMMAFRLQFDPWFLADNSTGESEEQVRDFYHLSYLLNQQMGLWSGVFSSVFISLVTVFLRVLGHPPVGQFTVAHPPVVKLGLVQPPARAVLGLTNPQPTKLQSSHPIVGALKQLGDKNHADSFRNLFGCPNNWVTGLQFGGLGIGEAKDCPGWWLDQPALDNWRLRNGELTNQQLTGHNF
ncbi:unnamed protein product [Notodromas monacha]|uniref:Sodium-dependent multivitamin transporter n=1 Tax=Notodromas monacha TaxID=399045 RepID=A0A7R9BUA3_9CRUS|nr:unnamed protein product [Notodromas monacha]CAG0920869.1 unnamed protein product [Notodromas monacha]